MTGEITCIRCDSDIDGITSSSLPKKQIVILKCKGKVIRVYEVDCFSVKVIE